MPSVQCLQLFLLREEGGRLIRGGGGGGGLIKNFNLQTGGLLERGLIREGGTY